MGLQIRDIHGEFEGADFRDDETQLLFAYDYKNKYDLRVYGHNVKPCLHREMKRLSVEIVTHGETVVRIRGRCAVRHV